MTTRAADELRRAERLAEPGPCDDRGDDGLERRDDRRPRRADVPERARQQRERDHRPDDDDEADERPDGRRVLGEVPLERDGVVEHVPREVPERLDDGPEQGGEEEAVERERGGIAVSPLALGHQEVRRQGERTAEGRGDADGAEGDPGPQLDDEGETEQAHRHRDPDAPSRVLLVDEAREEGDEERRGELDEERDARRAGSRSRRSRATARGRRRRDRTPRGSASSRRPTRSRDRANDEQEREEEQRGARVADLRRARAR